MCIVFFGGTGHSSDEVDKPQKVMDELLQYVKHDEIGIKKSQIYKDLEKWFGKFIQESNNPQDSKLREKVIEILKNVDYFRAGINQVTRETLIRNVKELKQKHFVLPKDEEALLLFPIASSQICDPTSVDSVMFMAQVNDFVEEKKGVLSLTFKKIIFGISKMWDKQIKYREFKNLIIELTNDQLITANRINEEKIKFDATTDLLHLEEKELLLTSFHNLVDQVLLSVDSKNQCFIRPSKYQQFLLQFWKLTADKNLQKGFGMLEILVTPHKFSKSLKSRTVTVSGENEKTFHSVLHQMIEWFQNNDLEYSNLQEIQAKFDKYKDKFNKEVTNLNEEKSLYLQTVQTFFEATSQSDISKSDLLEELQKLRQWPEASKPSLFLWSQGIDIYNLLESTHEFFEQIQETINAKLYINQSIDLRSSLPEFISGNKNVNSRSFDPEFWKKMTEVNFKSHFFSEQTLKKVLVLPKFEALATCVRAYTSYIQDRIESTSFNDTISFNFQPYKKEVGLKLDMEVITILSDIDRSILQDVRSNNIELFQNLHQKRNEIQDNLLSYNYEHKELKVFVTNLFAILLDENTIKESVIKLHETNFWDRLMMKYTNYFKKQISTSPRIKDKKDVFWEATRSDNNSLEQQIIRMLKAIDDETPVPDNISVIKTYKKEIMKRLSEAIYKNTATQQIDSVNKLFEQIYKRFEINAWIGVLRFYPTYLQLLKKSPDLNSDEAFQDIKQTLDSLYGINKIWRQPTDIFRKKDVEKLIEYEDKFLLLLEEVFKDMKFYKKIEDEVKKFFEEIKKIAS